MEKKKASFKPSCILHKPEINAFDSNKLKVTNNFIYNIFKDNAKM